MPEPTTRHPDFNPTCGLLPYNRFLARSFGSGRMDLSEKGKRRVYRIGRGPGSG